MRLPEALIEIDRFLTENGFIFNEKRSWKQPCEVGSDYFYYQKGKNAVTIHYQWDKKYDWYSELVIHVEDTSTETYHDGSDGLLGHWFSTNLTTIKGFPKIEYLRLTLDHFKLI